MRMVAAAAAAAATATDAGAVDVAAGAVFFVDNARLEALCASIAQLSMLIVDYCLQLL